MTNQPVTIEGNQPKQGYDFAIGSGFIALITYRWAATIVQEWGQKPSQQFGTVLGLAVVFAAGLFLLDLGLWRLQFSKPIRSALWAAAAIGPYAGLVAATKLAHPVWSEMAGLVGTLLVFVGFYFLEKKVQSE